MGVAWPARVGVLVSGTGSNLQALIDAGIPIAAVAANVPDAPALARVEALGAADRAPSRSRSIRDRDARDGAMAEWLESLGVGLVVCAGYMHLLRLTFLSRFPDRVVNVHPALLPAFPGAHAVEDALAAGVAESGATVHLVDEGVDTGRILRQEPVPVFPEDTPASAARADPARRAPAAARGREGAARGMRRALLSVYDKTGIAAFAAGAAPARLRARSRAAAPPRLLADDGIPVVPLEELTGFAEMLGHRVVTLHPAVHGGILARRDVPEDVADLETHGIAPIDLVCVNLYPFEQTVGRLDVEWDEAIEQIDIGGPALLRAAAKNHAHVIPVCRPADYELVLRGAARRDDVSVETRRALAWTAFTRTASYDAAVAGWLARGQGFPETLVPVFDRALELAYGENPHQEADLLRAARAPARTCSRASSSCTGSRSRSTTSTTSRPRGCSRLELDGPACVIVKHANPCGVGVAETIEEAYEKALAADPVSAYGGVVVLNRPVSAALGERLAEQFVEVLFAPGYDAVAMEALVQKPDVRILNDQERRAFAPSEWDFKRVMGGLLVQERDLEPDPLDGMEVVCGELETEGWDDLLFAWTVVKHTLSNAIVIARGGQTLGIGARPDEPGRRGADRGREGARARPFARGRGARLGCVLPLRRRPRSSRSRRASARSSSRAARSGTTRSSQRCATRARRWCSRAGGTSGTDLPTRPTAAGLPAIPLRAPAVLTIRPWPRYFSFITRRV